jgi:hypothetical protein
MIQRQVSAFHLLYVTKIRDISDPNEKGLISAWNDP